MTLWLHRQNTELKKIWQFLLLGFGSQINMTYTHVSEETPVSHSLTDGSRAGKWTHHLSDIRMSPTDWRYTSTLVKSPKYQFYIYRTTFNHNIKLSDVATACHLVPAYYF